LGYSIDLSHQRLQGTWLLLYNLEKGHNHAITKPIGWWKISELAYRVVVKRRKISLIVILLGVGLIFLIIFVFIESFSHITNFFKGILTIIKDYFLFVVIQHIKADILSDFT
jgi:hypothetical protein